MSILTNLCNLSKIFYFISSFLFIAHYSSNNEFEYIVKLILVCSASYAGNYIIKNCKTLFLKNFFVFFVFFVVAFILSSFVMNELFKISLFLTIALLVAILIVELLFKQHLRSFRK